MGRMTDTHPVHHDGHGLSEKELSVALFGKYAALAVYGGWAALVEIPTFVIVGSSTFAIAWAVTVTVFALLAAIGVARTWVTGHHRLEQWSTAAFVLAFTGYSSALIYRAGSTGDWATAPLALIPIAVVILPTIQFYRLVRRAKRAKNAEAAAS